MHEPAREDVFDSRPTRVLGWLDCQARAFGHWVQDRLEDLVGVFRR